MAGNHFTMKKSTTIHRARIGKDIIAEFVVPSSKKAQQEGRVAILCQGAPTMPGKNSVLTFLAEKGFYAILPRYRGTWESAGTFLKEDPTEDIKEVIDALTGPFLSLWEDVEYRLPKKIHVTLFASSFGGPAAFFLSTDKRVSKVVTFSPVCDWSDQAKNKPYDLKYDFLKNVYGEGYRMAKNGWTKLAKGDFYNPMTAIDRIDPTKVLILHAEDDAVVSIASVERYAVVTDANLLVSKDGGHMGLSEMTDPGTWTEVAKFLKK